MEQFENNTKFSKFQEGMRNYFEYRKNAPVQAFINSISLPDSIDNLLYFMTNNDRLLDPEHLIINSTAQWSVPRWCKRGDIVLFMVTVTSSQAISRVRSEIKRRKSQLSSDDYRLLKYGLMREESIYKNLGGCIFAVGRVAGQIVKYPDDVRVYADISDITILENPLPYNNFKNKVPVSKGGSITPVYSEKYSILKTVMSKQNVLPKYVLQSHSAPIREHYINRSNWLDIAKYYRFHYTLEEQFRKAFVDYLLKEISDSRKIYAECYCKKDNGQHGYIDNIVLFNGKYLPVEVKLNVDLETNLIGQVTKYCSLSVLNLDDMQVLTKPIDNIYDDKVVIIDTYGIYLYDDNIMNYTKIYDFFNLSSKEDLQLVRKLLIDSLDGFQKKQKTSVRQNDIYINMLDSEITGVNTYCEDSISEMSTEHPFQTSHETTIKQLPLNAFEQYLVTNLDPEEALERINTMTHESPIDVIYDD
ncbi:MAG: hypothetical protein IKG34_00860 [Solobacterium sp.]|nr:hypothetical protein [Solobacterium sp.]